MWMNSIISRMANVFVLYNICFDVVLAYPAKINCSGSCFKPTVEIDTIQYYQKIELIKKDLLQKLGLTEPPHIRSSAVIPQVLIDYVGITQRLPQKEDTERTEKIDVIAEKGT